MIRDKFLLLGVVLAGVSVGLGAFGAHGLKALVTEAQLITFETGVRYQFFHSFALIFAFFLQDKFNLTNRSSLFFLLGIILFSGSLYLLSLREILEWSALKFLGPITPLGGVCFLIGWGLLFFDIYKKAKQ